jgi:hypothetical protein
MNAVVMMNVIVRMVLVELVVLKMNGQLSDKENIC